MSNEAANKAKYSPLIKSLEERYNLPDNFLYDLVQKESSFNEDIISGSRLSGKGARGIAQFMPDTAKAVAKELGIAESDMYKPEVQLKMAASELSKYLKNYSGSSNLNISQNAKVFAYAEYNAGAPHIKRALDLAKQGKEFLSALPGETQDYVQSVKGSSNLKLSSKMDASASKRIFLNFYKLDSNITNLIALKTTDKFAKFLLGVGQGKIISIK